MHGSHRKELQNPVHGRLGAVPQRWKEVPPRWGPLPAPWDGGDWSPFCWLFSCPVTPGLLSGRAGVWQEDRDVSPPRASFWVFYWLVFRGRDCNPLGGRDYPDAPSNRGHSSVAVWGRSRYHRHGSSLGTSGPTGDHYPVTNLKVSTFRGRRSWTQPWSRCSMAKGWQRFRCTPMPTMSWSLLDTESFLDQCLKAKIFPWVENLSALLRWSGFSCQMPLSLVTACFSCLLHVLQSLSCL